MLKHVDCWPIGGTRIFDCTILYVSSFQNYKVALENVKIDYGILKYFKATKVDLIDG